MTSETDCSDFILPLHDGDGIFAFTTTRGVCNTLDPYSAFSVCHYTGDTPAHISLCRSALADRLGVTVGDIIVPRQTHSDNIAVITDDTADAYENTDALVTTLPGLVIGINTADCVPLLMYDAKARVAAAIHAGWRGTVARIAAKTVAAMTLLGASASEIRVLQGPSICPGCFEVGDEVVGQFADAGFPVNRICNRHQATGKAHIDLREANVHALTETGVLRGNISDPAGCPHCTPGRFFSARRLGIASGRTFTAIMLR